MLVEFDLIILASSMTSMQSVGSSERRVAVAELRRHGRPFALQRNGSWGAPFGLSRRPRRPTMQCDLCRVHLEDCLILDELRK